MKKTKKNKKIWRIDEYWRIDTRTGQQTIPTNEQVDYLVNKINEIIDWINAPFMDGGDD